MSQQRILALSTHAHTCLRVLVCGWPILQAINVVSAVLNHIPSKTGHVKDTWVVNKKGARDVEEPAVWGQAGGGQGCPGEGRGWTASEERQRVSSPGVLTSGEASA